MDQNGFQYSYDLGDIDNLQQSEFRQSRISHNFKTKTIEQNDIFKYQDGGDNSIEEQIKRFSLNYNKNFLNKYDHEISTNSCFNLNEYHETVYSYGVYTLHGTRIFSESFDFLKDGVYAGYVSKAFLYLMQYLKIGDTIVSTDSGKRYTVKSITPELLEDKDYKTGISLYNHILVLIDEDGNEISNKNFRPTLNFQPYKHTKTNDRNDINPGFEDKEFYLSLDTEELNLFSAWADNDNNPFSLEDGTNLIGTDNTTYKVKGLSISISPREVTEENCSDFNSSSPQPPKNFDSLYQIPSIGWRPIPVLPTTIQEASDSSSI